MKAEDGERRAARFAIRVAILGLAVALAGCDAKPPQVPVATITPEPSSAPAPTVNSTPLATVSARPTVSPRPTATPLAYLPLNADEVREVATGRSLNFTCPDVDGTGHLLWTCYGDGVVLSLYGAGPARVTAMRVVTDAPREVDRRSWLGSWASLVGEIQGWVYDEFGSNKTTFLHGVWARMTHDATSDSVLISTKQIGP